MAKQWQDELISELLEDSEAPKFLLETARDPRFLEVLKTFGSKPTYVNFDSSEGALKQLYRVVKDEEGVGGKFWSPSKPPKTEAEWRARDAVRNDWNRGGAYVTADVPPPEAAFIGEIGPQNLKGGGHHGYYLEGGGTQIFAPQSPAKNIEYWYTEWNAPVDAVQAARKAGTTNECDL
ncbi:hypothetical protein [Thalassospira sp. MCCC 1A01428]|uniref:hypothetical protein n=1 Tax=Thalassospira sp. MCCC 1A01428 TaxID=1470575 RepID=UPI000A1EB314|nr:hypothetical protein [Thalassospira sp. MCCC 1A01428]OSQ33338.1 hypothetical protein THS27_26175 [Thalassospira sp. MCCC 1A01428]